ncbi:MAG: dihydropteroate synthase [Clostridiaceae bacterium]|jgi:dihydropteroate synthase|nr:dihydropteroate synthase [Clostridiaceae bacterium]
MHDFVLKEIKNANLTKEIENIGFDKSYIPKVVNKFEYKNIKIYKLSVAQANILKQLALSTGTDCATNRDVITGKAELTDVILAGSISQLLKIADKLQFQPFGLKDLSNKLKEICNKNNTCQTKIMGILNITDNSFSDGGMYNDFEKAKKHLLEMIEDGADIIDIGAESTKPYSTPVDSETQIKKIIPILDFIKSNNMKTEISIDTRSAKVAKECIKYDVQYINDVSGLDYDNEMIKVISQNNVKIIIQHSLGTPENMQNSPHYDNLIDEIYLKLKDKINFAIQNGVSAENILIDVGIGFGKTREDNFELIRRIEEFKSLNCPIVLGLSRKSLLNMPDESNEAKDIFTVALNALAIERNVDIIRVHNVKLHKKLINLLN